MRRRAAILNWSFIKKDKAAAGEVSIAIIDSLLQVNTTKTIIFGLPARFSKHFVRHRKMSVKVRGKNKGRDGSECWHPAPQKRNLNIFFSESLSR